MLTVYEIDGVVPVVHPAAFVDPAAVLIGDVVVGPGVYVGPGASLRGDFGRILLEEGCNLQDNCVLHTLPNDETVVEANGHIGHGAILHGCRIGTNAMVGMGAVVMDRAVVGECSIVAAMAFVKAGMVVPPQTLVAGIPAKVVRPLSDAEVAWKTAGTTVYQDLARRCLASYRPTRPLTEMEPGRKRLTVADFPTIGEARRKAELSAPVVTLSGDDP